MRAWRCRGVCPAPPGRSRCKGNLASRSNHVTQDEFRVASTLAALGKLELNLSMLQLLPPSKSKSWTNVSLGDHDGAVEEDFWNYPYFRVSPYRPLQRADDSSFPASMQQPFQAHRSTRSKFDDDLRDFLAAGKPSNVRSVANTQAQTQLPEFWQLISWLTRHRPACQLVEDTQFVRT